MGTAGKPQNCTSILETVTLLPVPTGKALRLLNPGFKEHPPASFQLRYFYVKKKKKYLPGSHANLEHTEKMGAKPDPKVELHLAAISLCKTGRTLHHPQLQDLRGTLIPKGSWREAVRSSAYK